MRNFLYFLILGIMSSCAAVKLETYPIHPNPKKVEVNQQNLELMRVDLAQAQLDNYFIIPDPNFLVAANKLRAGKILIIPQLHPEDIFERLEYLQSFMEINLTYNRLVHEEIEYLLKARGGRKFTKQNLERSTEFFPIIEKYLHQHGLPDELKFLASIESGLQPQIRSRAGAVGLWQFMPSTGRIFGLNQNKYVDYRQDPFAATQAAMLYLTELYEIFDDWHLALAAYNCGPGKVGRLMKKYRKNDFWSLYRYLPRETRAYVPKFIAMVYAMHYATEYSIQAEEVQMMPHFLEYETTNAVDLIQFSLHLGLDTLELVKLNPQYRNTKLPKNSQKWKIRIPESAEASLKFSEHCEQFVLVQPEIQKWQFSNPNPLHIQRAKYDPLKPVKIQFVNFQEDAGY